MYSNSALLGRKDKFTMNKQLLLRWASIALLCFTVLGMSIATTTSSTHAASAPHAVSSGLMATTHAADAQTKAYWTTARMESAISADVSVKNAKVGPHQVAPITGAAQSKAPSAPQKASAAKAALPQINVNPNAFALGYPYAFPYSSVGKVFFTDPATGGNFQCSGTLVTSNNLSTVDTAGHCVSAGGGNRFFTNWVFCAQYFYGCPSGFLWTARQLWTHSNWLSNGWLAFDYGAAVLSPNGNGFAQNFLGSAGWTFNQSYSQTFFSFGFPAAPPFDGGRLWYCPSGLFSFSNPSPGPTTFSITCDMTGGSSGGGFLISLNGFLGYVNGHNDFKFNNDPAHMYSPYYGNDWFAVFNAAQNS